MGGGCLMAAVHDDGIENHENTNIVKKDVKVTSSKIPVEKVLNITSSKKDIDFDGVLARLMQYTNMADALAHIERAVEYVVQIPVKHQKAFQAGELFINQNSKTGVMWPTLYKSLEGGKRQFVDNLPIRSEEIIQGNPFESIAIGYHNLYMQQRINELAEIMNQTYRTVERIEQGQKDDRIGFLLAGRDQILLAINSESKERVIAIEQGRSNMFVAQKQLLQTFKRRVNSFEAISESKWKRFGTELLYSGSLRRKDKEFMEIQEYYALYLHATQMIAASYAICGQIESAEQVFNIAEKEMKMIDFNALKTLQYIHKENTEMFYYHADEYVASERNICLEDAQDYDAISIQISGEKLLEVFENGRTKEISKSDTK